MNRPILRSVALTTTLLIPALFMPDVCAAGEEDCLSDINGDGEVAFSDLLLILADWGPCPDNAGAIDVPVSTSTDVDEVFGTATAHCIDQSGLSTGYVASETDFDSYLAGNPTHNSQPEANVWLMSGFAGNFDMDFGKPVTASGIAIWNKDDVFGCNNIILLAADDPGFGDPTTLFSGALDFQTNQSAVPHQRIDFDTVTARYFRIEILDNHGASFTGLSEVAMRIGSGGGSCDADIDGDNAVGFSDLLLLLANWGPCPGPSGGLTIAPADTSTNIDELFGTSTDNVVNQSGLSAGYVQGSTDFDAYIAGNPTHNGGPEANVWLMSGVAGNFDMDFGAAVTVDAIAIWNKDGAFGVSGFNLLAADNPDFTGATVVIGFEVLTFQANQAAIPHDRFDFATTTARYFRIEILDNYGETITGLSELVFRGEE